MTIDDSQIREVLENGLGSLQVPGGIPDSLLRRAKRRRIATSLVSGALATTLFAGAVYGASALTNNERADIPPAQSPRICAPEEVDIFTDISDPVGTGAGHYGVLLEVRITPQNMSCEPTLYIELDDSPVLPPDHEGPDADEFRRADENPCLRTGRAHGDFLYSDQHTIDVGTGCDPDDPSPHSTQVSLRFDGKTHEQIDDTEAKTASELPPCEDENSKSYGQEPPGKWLKDVLLELGAPGGYPLTEEDVRDTGTALWIDIPEYDNDPTIYATMVTPDIDPNVPRSTSEKEIGRRQSYTLYFDETDYKMETYRAVNDRWQLALLGYPGAGNDEVLWPDGTVAWLKQAVDIAEESPPQCEGPIT